MVEYSCMTVGDFIKKRKYLVWSTRNYDGLSTEAIVEAVLNYGDFDDIRKMISILGMKKVAGSFRKQIRRRRNNYDPKIMDYFKRYFQKYAPDS